MSWKTRRPHDPLKFSRVDYDKLLFSVLATIDSETRPQGLAGKKGGKWRKWENENNRLQRTVWRLIAALASALRTGPAIRNPSLNTFRSSRNQNSPFPPPHSIHGYSRQPCRPPLQEEKGGRRSHRRRARVRRSSSSSHHRSVIQHGPKR